MRTFFLLILIFPLTAHSFTSYKPFQDVDPNNKEKFISSESIYLACERESSENTIEDLLNNKILKLDRRIKKGVERRFKYVSQGGIDKNLDEILDGKSEIDIRFMGRYAKNWYFLGLKISTYMDDENRVRMCNSEVGKKINNLENCSYSLKTSRSYDYEKYTSSGNSFIQETTRLDRETLSYVSMNKSTLATSSYKYQCHLSNKDEIDTLQENYKNFLKPLQDEWEKHVNEWIPKEKEKRNKVKI